MFVLCYYVTFVLQKCYNENMLKANTAIYLDTLRPKQNGLCSIKIKVTYNRKRKYFSTGIDVQPSEFKQIFYGSRRTNEQKAVKKKIEYLQDKADVVINSLDIFSFDAFTEQFLDSRNTATSISVAFDKYIDELKLYSRLGTADSYNCAKISLTNFKPDLTFAEVTPNFLKRYQKWMEENGRSISTVGIYLRSLKAVYNAQNIDRSAYPFGVGKFVIPTSRNIKKALTLDEIAKIYNYKAPSNSKKEMAKDYWMFIYLSGGINVKDFCSLKWKNIDGSTLTYTRAKTRRSNQEQKTLSVALKPESLEIVKKWSVPSSNKEAFVFPHINNRMSEGKKRMIGKKLTETINKYVGEIAREEGIDKKVTTTCARHSFATVLKRSGVKTNMISELLGHSSLNVTERYLDGFEDEKIQEKTDVLTSFK